MMTCIDNFGIPLKDLFYLVGIIVTLFLGIKNISILNNNRKNTLRESVYKEQMNFMLKLSGELINLHRSLTSLSTKKFTVTDEFKLEMIEKIVLVHEILLSNAVICSENISELTLTMLSKADIFIEEKYLERETYCERYDDYFLSFINILSEFKSELGIKVLNKENQSLFDKRNGIFKV